MKTGCRTVGVTNQLADMQGSRGMPNFIQYHAMRYDEILTHYRLFVSHTADHYAKTFNLTGQTGSATIYARYWDAMADEVVHRASQLLEQEGRNIQDKQKLLLDLQQIAEKGLLKTRTAYVV
jgi:hypothetical protein